MPSIPEELLNAIRSRSVLPAPPPVCALADGIRATYGEALQAILFYGSCLRTGDDRGGMVDLYVIVGRYRDAYRSSWWAALNQLLPPNVFYLEIPFEGRMVRAKYAVLSMADLERGASPAWFHSYIWGRFAQPTVLLYASGPLVAERVCAALCQAVLTFIGRVIPRLPADFSVEDLWLRGLTLSYRTEFRAERPEKMAASSVPHRITTFGSPMPLSRRCRFRLRSLRGAAGVSTAPGFLRPRGSRAGSPGKSARCRARPSPCCGCSRGPSHSPVGWTTSCGKSSGTPASRSRCLCV
jgi:hypothetical protein